MIWLFDFVIILLDMTKTLITHTTSNASFFHWQENCIYTKPLPHALNNGLLIVPNKLK